MKIQTKPQQSLISKIQNNIAVKLNKEQQEIEDLSKILESENENLKQKKILELGKLQKTLFVNIEKQKSERQRIEKQMQQIKKDINVQLQKISDKPQEYKNDIQQKIVKQQQKTQTTQEKLSVVQNNLNKALRLIQREIGENDYSLDKMLNDENSWKQRQQLIEILKSKIRDSNRSNINQDKSGVQKLTALKNKDIELTKTTLEFQIQENNLLQSKLTAINSRKKTLEDEIKKQKKQNDQERQILIEKSNHDDEYILALKQEIERLSNKPFGEEIKNVYQEIDDVQVMTPEERAKLQNQILYEKDQLQKQISLYKDMQKETKINVEISNQLDPILKEKLENLQNLIKEIQQDNQQMIQKHFGDVEYDMFLQMKDVIELNSAMKQKYEVLNKKLNTITKY